MFYFNTLNLKQISGGNQVKQGDFGSTFTYKLANEKNRELNAFDQKTAYVNLVLDNNIIFSTTVIVDDSTVTFNIDKAIPTGLYFLEIKIDSYIFPSDRQTIILVTAGAVAYDLKELVPNYDTNMTITGILSDLSQKGIDITNLRSKIDEVQLETTAQLAKTIRLDESNLSLNNFNENDRAIIQGLAEGEINAVLGIGNVKRENIADKAITPEKTSFIDATNLFISNEVQVGKTIGTNGQVESDSVRWLGGYVPVSAEEKLSISSGAYRIHYYNKSRSPVGSRSGSNSGTVTVAPDVSIQFMRISGDNTNLYDKIMLNRGGELLPFRPYGIMKKEHLPEDKGLLLGEVEPKHTNFFHIPNNLLNLNTVLIGKSVDLAGNIIDDPIRWLSDFIEVGYENKVFSITKDTYRIGYYDKNFNFLNRVGITGSNLINLNIPKDDPRKYIRIAGTINPEIVMLNRGSTLLPWESGAVVLKKQYTPSDLQQIDTKQIMEQVRKEMKGQLTQYQPSFPKLTFETVTTGWSIPKWLSADGEVIYGNSGKELLQSFDEWKTLIRIGKPLDYEVSGMRELGDGELLVSTLRDESINVKSKVYKTVGYDRNNPKATTFKEVLEADSAQSNINNWWGFSVYENIVTISDYGLKGAQGAKNVWVSTDYGETFKLIFNQHTIGQEVAGAPPYTNTAHMHTAAYDPYFNRIWVVVGDNPNTATYYSDDMGTSWTFVKGSSIMQYTGILALPNAVLFGSDRNPNGVHVYHRGNKSEMPVIEPLLLVNDSKIITHVFQLPFKKDWNPATPTYFASEGISASGGRTVVIGTVDGKTANLMFEGDLSGPYSGNMRCPLGPTAQGNIVSYMDDSSISGYRIVKAKAPTWSRV